ncbi:unnamed protein product [Orchesella dallaii]|uniref:Uncharacterized protein n=1 Tax=Orchesella dallaii TaxID=48710 RepID=A0ABP1S0W2_9HEXA
MREIPPQHSNLGDNILLEYSVLASIVTLLFICLYLLKKSKFNHELRSKKRLPGPGQHFLGSIANIFALRNMTKAAFGKSVSDFENMNNIDGEPSFTKVVNGLKRIVAVRVLNPWLLYNPIWRLHPMSKYGDMVAKMMSKYAAKAASADENLVGPERTRLGIQEDLFEAGVPLDGILEESITLLTTVYI